jgi:hypothetical protein
MQDLCGKDGTETARRKTQLFWKTRRYRDQALLHVAGNRRTQFGELVFGQVAGDHRAARFQRGIRCIAVGRPDFQHGTICATGMLSELERHRCGFPRHNAHRVAGRNESRFDLNRPLVRDSLPGI